MKAFFFITAILYAFTFHNSQAQTGKTSAKETADTTLANEYLLKGKDFLISAKFDSSIYYCNIAANLFEKYKIWDNFVRCNYMISRNYEFTGELKKSEKYANIALNIGLKKIGENNKYVATTINQLGNIFLRKSEFDKALEYYYKSLKLKRKLFPEKHRVIANSYNNIAIVFLYKGNLKQGIKYFKKSLDIRLHLLGENSLQVAASYNNIGYLYDEIGDYNKALDYYNKSLTIKLQLLDSTHPDIAATYNNIAIIYKNMLDYSKAIDYHRKALSARRNSLRKNHPDIGASYHNLGSLYFVTKKYLLAKKYFNKALMIYNLTEYKEMKNIADCLNDLGEVNVKLNNYPKAKKYFLDAIKIKKDIYDLKNQSLAVSFLSLGNLFQLENKKELALCYFQKAIISLVLDFNTTDFNYNPVLKRIIVEKDLLDPLVSKAKLLSFYHANNHHLLLSFNTYDLAIKLIDKIRTGYKSEGSKLFLGEETKNIFEGAIKVALELYKKTGKEKYKLKAFEFSEKSKVSVLNNSLQESWAKKYSGIPQNILDKEYDLKVNLAYYETEIQKEKTKKNGIDSTKLNDFENRFFELKQEYDKLIEKLEKEYPKYYNLKYKTKVASVSGIRNKLKSNDSFIEYFVGDSTLHIFTISKNNFNVTSLLINNSFNQIVKNVYYSLKQNDKKTFAENNFKLYKYVIEPIEPQIANKNKLIIIPDGLLSFIPFEVLQDINFTANTNSGKTNYLIEKYDISYNYSAGLFLRKHKGTKKTEGLICFAPVFNEENNYITERNTRFVESMEDENIKRSITVNGKVFSPLKYTEEEVNNITNLCKQNGIKTKSYLHTSATEENFKKESGKYKFVHVATHGLVNGNNPKLSGLIFSQSDLVNDSLTSEDGILYSAETYNLNLNSDLLVLSSCKSGIGKIIKGEGMISLTRGFLYSGAKNIIISLWNMADKTTKDLMTELYKNILSGKSFSKALRNAKLKMMKDKNTAFPSYWSGFVLIGN